MQAIETIPLFRTRSTGGGAGAVAAKEAAPIAQPTEPAPLPPLRNHTGKPALPADQWVDGIATLGEALRIQKTLAAQHATVCGIDNETNTYYVRGYGWQRVTI